MYTYFSGLGVIMLAVPLGKSEKVGRKGGEKHTNLCDHYRELYTIDCSSLYTHGLGIALCFHPNFAMRIAFALVVASNDSLFEGGAFQLVWVARNIHFSYI